MWRSFLRHPFSFFTPPTAATIQQAAIILLCIGVSIPLSAKEENKYSYVDLAIVDMPFNLENNNAYPSMRQSLKLTTSFYNAIHYGLINYSQNWKDWQQLSLLLGFDVLSTWLPFGSAWLHEEWHRAVMLKHDINSYNEVYDLPLFAETIAVSQVNDGELSQLKSDSPADMIRLSSAGLEAGFQMNRQLEKDVFFFHSNVYPDFLILSNTLNSIAYLFTCASDSADELTDKILDSEDQNQLNRDFTGLDCNAWVYDLFRPDESYSARGTHPSGTGVLRYRNYSDLSSEERAFLRLQRNLSLLNLVNPFILGKYSFFYVHKPTARLFHYNFNMRHYLNPFGYDIKANLFLRFAGLRLLISKHSYFNKARYFPGLSIELLDYKLSEESNWTMNAEIDTWLQPRGLSFTTDDAIAGYSVGLTIAHKTGNWQPYLQLYSKSRGWKEGIVYLEQHNSIIAGFNYFLGR